MSAFPEVRRDRVREAYEATKDAMAMAEEKTGERDEGGDAMRTATTRGPVAAVEEYQKQLAWREFYTQVLYHNPEVVTENYKEYEEGIAWRDDPDEIAAWKRGETGTQSSTPDASSVRRRSCTTACG